MTPDEERITEDIARLAASINGLRIEVERWRTHTGSTGYFILTAVEDLQKAVAELAALVKASAH